MIGRFRGTRRHFHDQPTYPHLRTVSRPDCPSLRGGTEDKSAAARPDGGGGAPGRRRRPARTAARPGGAAQLLGRGCVSGSRVFYSGIYERYKSGAPGIRGSVRSRRCSGGCSGGRHRLPPHHDRAVAAPAVPRGLYGRQALRRHCGLLISEVPGQRRGNGPMRQVPRLAFGKPRHSSLLLMPQRVQTRAECRRLLLECPTT